MKLSDVVSGAGLAGYAEVALLLFLLVFLVVALRVLFARTTSFDHAARMPLEDEPFSHPSTRPGAE